MRRGWAGDQPWNFPESSDYHPTSSTRSASFCLKARRAGEDIIDFGMGNPDEPTPPHIVNKLIEAAAKGANHRYSVSRGVYKLRLAICDWYKRRYGVELDPDSEAIVTDRLEGGHRPSGAGDSRSGRRGAGADADLSDPSVRMHYRGRAGAGRADAQWRGILRRNDGRGQPFVAAPEAPHHELPA